MIPRLQDNPATSCAVWPFADTRYKDVVVTTARSALVNLAYDAAADLVYQHNQPLAIDTVHAVATRLIQEGKVSIEEHVVVTSEGITVCINTEDVNDESIVWVVVERVAEALEYLDGRTGTVVNSLPLQISLNQVLPLMCNLR